VHNCNDPDPKKREYFEQPVYQTAQMFVGESGCWLVVGMLALYRRFAAKHGRGDYEAVATTEDASGLVDGESAQGLVNGDATDSLKFKEAHVLRGWRVVLLSLPAICDICGTTLMNLGLLLVAASIYQMTRGALVLFVGLFSVIFLKRQLPLFKWLSLVGVVLGVAVVGIAGAIYPDQKASKPGAGPVPDNGSGQDPVKQAEVSADALRAIVGVLLIAGAQIFTATQFVLEEWILERSNIEPIRVVGWEGLFGLLVTVVVQVVLHFAVGTGYFDMVEGWRQMTQNKAILITSFLIMISIG
jgi:drug/metabolite transporter (DMT)-like permease